MNYRMIGKYLTGAVILSLLLFCANSASAATHYVFAHYMVCNQDYGYSVAAYEHDIQDAQSAGIDGFALNCGDWNSGSYKADTAAMFRAANSLGSGFKLFFSADMSGGLTAAEIVNMITTYAHDPSYFTYSGKPILSTWDGNTFKSSTATQLRWEEVKAELTASGNSVFFVPYLYSENPAGTGGDDEIPQQAEVQSNYDLTWKPVIDGYFYPATAAIPSWDNGCRLSVGNVVHAAGKIYMAGLSPQYWGDKQIPGRRYDEYDGGEGIVSQWENIISPPAPSVSPDWVEMFTWNDFDESTYWSPIDDPDKYWPYYSHPQLGFYGSHVGATKLASYFISWYKTGTQPAVPGGVDNIYYFYRDEPKAMSAPNDPQGAVSAISGDIADDIYITTILPSAAQVVVTSGGNVTTVNVPAGLNSIRVPFTVGQQSIALWRNNQAVILLQGAPIVAQQTDYNFNYFTGYGHD